MSHFYSSSLNLHYCVSSCVQLCDQGNVYNVAKALQKYDILFYEMLVIFIRCVVAVAVVFVCWYGSSPATGQRPGVLPNLGTGPGTSWQQ